MTKPARKARKRRITARAGVRAARPGLRGDKLEAAYREALEQQAATAEILRVISASPADAQPVFDAIARHAQRLFDAPYGSVARYIDGMLHLAAFTTTSAAGDESLRKLFPATVTGQGALGKAVLSGEPAWISDIETDPGYSAAFREGARIRGYRSLLAVPMLREGAAIGAIVVTRARAGRFTDHQIDLLRTFAGQAVIALENVRLFHETREALERQTATSQILTSISSSVENAQPVFDAIVRSLRQLFKTEFAAVLLARDGNVDIAAAEGQEHFVSVTRKAYPISLDDEEMLATRVIRGRKVLRLCPIAGNPDAPAKTEQLARVSGYNSIIVAPASPRTHRLPPQFVECIGDDRGEVGLDDRPQGHHDPDAHHQQHHLLGDRASFVAEPCVHPCSLHRANVLIATTPG